jgi:integral membrane protein
MKSLIAFVGYLEGFSFLILMGYAMPLKYIAGDPEMVSLMGSLHGGLFVAYIALLFLGVGKHWTFTALIHGFIACGGACWSVPFRRNAFWWRIRS